MMEMQLAVQARRTQVLHLNHKDAGGGAADFAFAFLARFPGTHRLLVGEKLTTDTAVDVYSHFGVDSLFSILDRCAWKLGARKTFKTLMSMRDNFNFTHYNLARHPWYVDADVVHLHNIHGGYFDLSALKRIALEKPVVMSLHDMWLLTGGEAYTVENENYKLGIGHTPYDGYYPLYGPLLDLRAKRIRDKKRILARIADRAWFVTGSRWLERCFREAFVYNDRLRVETIREGVDVSIYRPRKPRDWDRPRVLIVNSTIYYKGTEVFNKVLPRLPDTFDLYVIGEGIALRHGRYPVTRLDYIADREGLARLLADVDILVFPSLQDNSPLMVSYALAAGVCVIGSDVGGIHDQLSDGAGILFDRACPDDLFEKWSRAISDVGRCRAIGQAARAKVLADYNADHMYAQYERLYRSVVAVSRARSFNPRQPESTRVRD